MHVRRYPLFNEAGPDGGLPGGAAPAAAPAAPAGGAPDAAPGSAGAGTPAADGAPAAAAPAAGSLLARGAGAPAAGAAPAAPGAGDGSQPAAIPEKYLVKREDGTTDWEASALKQAQGYQHLAQKLGTDAPPKSPDEYAPELPNGLTMDALKTDPLFAGFLKGAHAKGFSNGQVSWLLGEFQQRVQLMQEQAADPAIAEAELGKVWTTPQAMTKGLGNAFRGTQGFAEDADHAARLEKKFGSDPDFIRLMARVGAELGEDRLPAAGLTAVELETKEALMRSPAYLDSKHPEHAVTVAKVRALYEKAHAGQ